MTQNTRLRIGTDALSRALLASLLAIMMFTVVSCGSDGGTDPGPPPDPPLLTSLSSAALSVGDTLVIVGEKFAGTTSANRVRFANSLANVPPFSATPETLVVVVPEWAASGPLQVTSSGVISAPVTVEILRGVGDVWVVGGAASFEFKLPDSGNEYLLLPHSASTSGSANYGYGIDPDSASVYPAPRRSSVASSGTVTFPMEFEQSIRRQAIEYIQRNAGKAQPLQKSPASAAAPAQQRTFDVLICTTCSTSDPNSYASVTADLKYTGNNVLIYADVNQPSGSFTDGDYATLGLEFDTETYDTNTTYFGPPTDIDGDGKVIALFTPRVNDLTPDGAAGNGFISGFFLVNDLAPNFFPSTSNNAEMFYAMVPDPNGEYGNAFSRSLVQGLIPATLAHEFEHMISFGYRFVVAGNGTSFIHTQLTWLEEGMAHMAEDLNGFTSSNRSRINLYLLDPGNVSLMGSDTLEQRGGIFLFLRYLADQLGEDILKPMTRNTCKGIGCVEGTTGVNFFLSVADYLATLYLDGAGVTLNPRYHYTSNVNLSVLANAIDSRDVSDGNFSGSLRGASGDYREMAGIQNPATTFKVTGAANGNVRVLVVRTQ